MARKKGPSWYCDFMINGVRYRPRIPEARTRREAEQAESKIKVQIYEGKYGAIYKPTQFASFVNNSYLPWARANKRSFYDDQLIAGVLCRFFRGSRLDQISPMLIEKFKHYRRDTPTKHDTTRAAATINRELSVLSKIFSLAISEKLIASNPCRDVKMFQVRNQRVRYATPEEEAQLMIFLTGHRVHLAPLVTVALYTGLRRSELFDLKWEESIDFGLAVVRVGRSKTESGKRTVPMNSLVLETLKELYGNKTSDYVFPSPKTGGRLIDVKTGFRKACADAKIGNFVFHDLRHTFGTRLADAGVDVVKIKELMGHASIMTTMRYMHASDEGKRAAVNKLPAYRLGTAWNCHPIVTNEKRQVA